MTELVGKNSVVLFHYTLLDVDGNPVETTRNGQPAAILYGHNNIIPGLERALKGRTSGEEFEVTVAAVDAYGPRREDLTQRLSKKYFAKPKALRTGQVTQIRTESGVRPVTVLKVGNKMVDVDLNHPQAGNDLHFQVSIVDVRAATPQELAHGHAHADGHDH